MNGDTSTNDPHLHMLQSTDQLYMLYFTTIFALSHRRRRPSATCVTQWLRLDDRSCVLVKELSAITNVRAHVIFSRGCSTAAYSNQISSI